MNGKMSELPELGFDMVKYQAEYRIGDNEYPFDRSKSTAEKLEDLHFLVTLLRAELYEYQRVNFELLRRLGVHHGL